MDLIEQHQTLIVNILSSHQNSLILAELKKKSKLANMYFIKALEKLETKKRVERVKIKKDIWIKLKK